MTHEELLVKIDKLTDEDFGVVLGPALRAAVELHGQYKFCQVCDDEDVYPCKTIQVIEKELE